MYILNDNFIVATTLPLHMIDAPCLQYHEYCTSVQRDSIKILYSKLGKSLEI